MKSVVDDTHYSKSARRFIKTRDTQEKERIRNAIEYHLKYMPPSGDIKPLQGYPDGRKRLRIGSIRIIFRYDKDNDFLLLSILDIGNRGGVYK